MQENETILFSIKQHVINFLSEKGAAAPVVSFEVPEKASFGDYSTNAALKYAREIKKRPMDAAQEIVQYLKGLKISGISKIEIAPPGYVNIFLNEHFLFLVLKDILALSGSFGVNDLQKGKKWVVEHTSPNPNKAMHLGHLRNNLVGMSLVHLLEWSGASVVCDAVDNNRGIAIAKLMWGFLSHMRKEEKTPVSLDFWGARPEKWYTPQELNLLPDIFITKCYVSGEKDYKNSTTIKSEIQDFVVRWEQKDANVWKLWAHVLSYSYQGINRTLTRLGNRWDKVWHEHEHYQEGKEYVMKGLKKGIFKKLEDGAVLTDLLSYELPDTILLKNDGTSLYITQDIALTALKKKTYHADKLVWVIGPEQSMAMKQLFAVCEQLSIGKRNDFTHVPYGYVGLKDSEGNFKKMSSRDGTVVLIDDLIDAVKKKIIEKFPENKNVSESAEVAEKLALAATKFSILKSDRNQSIAFDIEQSVETHGDSGVYVLYTFVRCNSILRKALSHGAFINAQENTQGEDIVKILALFPQMVKRSFDALSAHHIAQYLLKLCAAFNSWYAKEPILDNTEQQAHKLAVTKSVAQVIQNGLSILGIDVVKEI